jgi:vacuolar protein sorting-associated protein 13A/C
LAGIVVKPLQGAAADGVGGFIVGLGKGAVGAVAAPVAGVFGAVSAVSESVDANLKVMFVFVVN